MPTNHEPVRNEYLDQVREQQQRLEVDLKAHFRGAKVASRQTGPLDVEFEVSWQ